MSIAICNILFLISPPFVLVKSKFVEIIKALCTSVEYMANLKQQESTKSH